MGFAFTGDDTQHLEVRVVTQGMITLREMDNERQRQIETQLPNSPAVGSVSQRRQNAGFRYRRVQKVPDKIDTSNEVGLRDRALLGTLAYTFARIGAVMNLKVEDYFQTGKRSMIGFRRKVARRRRSPCTTHWRSFLTSIWTYRVLQIGKTHPFFRFALGKTRKVGNRPVTRKGFEGYGLVRDQLGLDP